MKAKVTIFIAVCLASFTISELLIAANPNNTTIEKRLSTVEDAVDKIAAEMDVLRSQSKMVITQTNLSFANRFYAKGGFAFVLPRRWAPGERSDTGLGAFLGFGQYFGRHNVGDIALEWDIYPSLSARYRFEFHLENPKVTIGPVIGYKLKFASTGPWDRFIDNYQILKDSFTFFGVILGFPLGGSMLAVEFTYLFNEQTFLVLNSGFHIFF